jgi:hypothetical protein
MADSASGEMFNKHKEFRRRKKKECSCETKRESTQKRIVS